MQMRFTLRCVQCMATSVLRDSATHVWCMRFARGREGIFDKERPGRPVVAVTDATIAAVDAFVRSDGTNV